MFFGFRHSHVPDSEFAAFWNLVDEALAEDGQVLVVDSLAEPTSTAADHVIERAGEVTRRLNDGREFRIVKQFWDAKSAGRAASQDWMGGGSSDDRDLLPLRICNSRRLSVIGGSASGGADDDNFLEGRPIYLERVTAGRRWVDVERVTGTQIDHALVENGADPAVR